jgi:hypothetical protein
VAEDFSDFHERFVAANANLDFIAHEFADVLRNLMRAMAATDPAAATYKAAQHMDFVAELLSKTEEKFGFSALFARTIEILDVDEALSEVDEAIVSAAKSGIKVIVERSCSDGAAQGRASQRRRDFLRDIEGIEEARTAAKARWNRRGK